MLGPLVEPVFGGEGSVVGLRDCADEFFQYFPAVLAITLLLVPCY